MARRNRPAFTLVELLVVIVIIAMLVGMLTPAVQVARERARRAECANNQHEIAVAIQQYESAIHRFPGYINRFGTTAITSGDTRYALSWPMVILPQIGREDLWRICRSLSTTDTVALQQATATMPQYVCRSAHRQDTAALTYVVNCGLQDLSYAQMTSAGVTTPDSASNGVFHNRYNYDAPTVTSSQIRDGASNTLMLSENVNLQQGNVNWLANTEQQVGMVFEWLDYGFPATAGTVQPTSDNRRINRGRDGAVDYVHARPSSNHPGGVNVVYCDGHHQFLSEGIQYLTFQHLMTPDGNRADRLDDTTYTAAQRPLLPPTPADEQLKSGQ
jgi:prepilin-type N-terminal cleavage/methylation domain-containing protein/prepilin-type processing-associated H-X9-DG protein